MKPIQDEAQVLFRILLAPLEGRHEHVSWGRSARRAHREHGTRTLARALLLGFNQTPCKVFPESRDFLGCRSGGSEGGEDGGVQRKPLCLSTE